MRREDWPLVRLILVLGVLRGVVFWRERILSVLVRRHRWYVHVEIDKISRLLQPIRARRNLVVRNGPLRQPKPPLPLHFPLSLTISPSIKHNPIPPSSTWLWVPPQKSHQDNNHQNTGKGEIQRTWPLLRPTTIPERSCAITTVDDLGLATTVVAEGSLSKSKGRRCGWNRDGVCGILVGRPPWCVARG